MRKYSLEISIGLIFAALVVGLMWGTLAELAVFLPYVLMAVCGAGLLLFLVPWSGQENGEGSQEKYAPKYFAQALLSSVVGVAIIVAAAALLNRERFSTTFDVTERQVNSLSEETEKFLASIDQDVAAYCIPSANPADRYCEENAYLRALYAEKTEKFQHAAIDLRDMATMAQVQPAGYSRLVLMSQDNRSEVVGEITESKLTNGLINLIKSKKTVYFLTGNGEPPISFEGQKNYANLSDVLKARAYEVKEHNITEGPLPEDARLVMAGSATVAYNSIVENELRKLLARGGRLILTLNPYRATGMNKFFADLGIELSPTLLVNNRGATSLGAQLAQLEPMRPPIVVGEFSQSSSITSVLSSRDIALADGARPFEFKDREDGDLKITHTQLASAFHAAPVTLTEQERNNILLNGPLNLEPDPGFDPQASYTVGVQIKISHPAALAEGLPSTSVALAGSGQDLQMDDESSDAASTEESETDEGVVESSQDQDAEVVLLGFELAGRYERAAPANSQILPLAVAHLHRDQELVSIPTKDFAPRQFDLEKNPGAYLFLFAGLLPVTMALSGFYVWMRRRSA